MKVIDANLYWFDEEIFKDDAYAERFLADVPFQYGTFGYFTKLENGKRQFVLEKPKGYANLNYVENDYLLEKILSDLDEAGIDQAIMKIPCAHEWMSLEICKRFNEGMANYQKMSNGRLKGLAVVPPIGSQEVKAEIEKCFKEYGFVGVQLVAHYGNKYLDDEVFEEFFSYLNKQETTVYIHHTPVPVEYNSIYEYTNIRRSYGRQIDQGIAVARELFSGFFIKYPNLKFVHSMLGGGFFAFKYLLFPKMEKKESVGRFETDNDCIEKQLKNNIYFEMSHAQPWGKEQLELAVKVLGADHILFGSSYPVRESWLMDGADFIRALNITEDEKKMILAGNSQRLYDLDTR